MSPQTYERKLTAILSADVAGHNLSTNPDHEYLADGITDQIITGLSMMPYIFVIPVTHRLFTEASH